MSLSASTVENAVSSAVAGDSDENAREIIKTVFSVDKAGVEGQKFQQNQQRQGVFAHVVAEAQHKLKYFKSDWTDGWTRPGLAFGAGVEIFATSLLTSMAFGLLYQVETNGALGIVASLASGGITGMIQAGFGGNPLTLCGQTGPVSLLYIFAWRFAKDADIDFAPWVAWIGLWSALMHWIVAAFALCEHRFIITHFSEQIFEMLVAADFITTGIRKLIAEWYCEPEICGSSLNDNTMRLNGLLALLLASGFVFLALALANTRNWSFFTRKGNRFATRFSSSIALIIWVIFAWLPRWVSPTWPQGVPQQPAVQSTFGLPTEHYFLAFLDMGKVSPGAAVGAIIPAFLLTVLFYVDHNISSMAAYQKGFNIKKGEAYNLDFFMLGVTVLLTGLMGLPASSGLIPQNPMHSRSLLYFKEQEDPEVLINSTRLVSATEESTAISIAHMTEEQRVDDSNMEVEAKVNVLGESEGVVSAATQTEEDQDLIAVQEENAGPKRFILEQRVSAMVHSMLLFVCIFLIPIIRLVPTCLIWGFFLVLATEAFHQGNEFLCRVGFLASSQGMIDTWDFFFLEVVPKRITTWFTLLQLACFSFVFIIAVCLPLISEALWVAVGSTFPFVILLYAIPLRSHIMPKYLFHKHHLAVLDNAETLVLEHPMAQAEPDADEAFGLYVGRGAQGMPHVVHKESVDIIERAFSNSLNSSNEELKVLEQMLSSQSKMD